MNLDPILLSTLERAPEECKTAHIHVSCDKMIMRHSIREIVISPRRDFRVSKHIRQKSSTSEGSGFSIDLHSPPLQEMLSLISEYRHAKGGLFNMAVQIAKQKSEPEALAFMAKLVYLLDKKKIKGLPDNPEKTIQALFQKQLNRLVKKLKEEEDLSICRMNVSRSLAKALVTTKGRFNLGLVPILCEIIPTLFKSDSGYQKSLISHLDSLSRHAELREKLSVFPRPHQNNRLGRELIETSLNLPPKTTIRSYHAKRCALTALLSHPRQEHVANCFALSIAIALFSNAIADCLDDFREILEYGCMRRKVNKQTMYFPALMKQPLTTVSERLNPKTHAWRIQKVLDATGNKMPPKLPKDTTVEQFLKSFGAESYDKACFVWESDTKNPLITIWSNILASMAEAKEDGLIKSAIIASAFFVIKQLGGTEEELENLRAQMIERIYLHYDPSVPPIYEEEEAGAFVLYDKQGYCRVDTGEKYVSFLSSLNTSDKVRRLFQAPDTLPRILSVYEQEGSRIQDNTNFDRLRHTPWVSRIGNNPKALVRTYSAVSDEGVSEQFFSKNPKDLFDQIIDFTKKLLDTIKGSREPWQELRIPFRIVGNHTFNMILTNPNFVRCLSEDPEKVLDELREVYRPKATMPLPQETLEQMNRYLKEKDFGLYQRLQPTPSFITLYDYWEHLKTEINENVASRKLFQFLPEKIKEEFNANSIHFADTNWQINGFDIHLAFAYNPFTLKLDIFHAEGHGALLYPLCIENEMEHLSWEIFSTPHLPQAGSRCRSHSPLLPEGCR